MKRYFPITWHELCVQPCKNLNLELTLINALCSGGGWDIISVAARLTTHTILAWTLFSTVFKEEAPISVTIICVKAASRWRWAKVLKAKYMGLEKLETLSSKHTSNLTLQLTLHSGFSKESAHAFPLNITKQNRTTVFTLKVSYVKFLW